jgi:hypothetical protein
MSTATLPVAATVAAPQPSGFLSFLKKAGQDILKVIGIGAKVAEEVAPEITAINPAVGTLLSTSAGIVLAAETAGQAAVAAAPTADTSAQKAALAVQGITPLAEKFCADLGLSAPTQEQVQEFNDHVVAALNVFGITEQVIQSGTGTSAAPASTEEATLTPAS